jgi:hypothetical protein
VHPSAKAGCALMSDDPGHRERGEMVAELMDRYRIMGDHLEALPDAARMPVLAALVGSVVRSQYQLEDYDEAITRFSLLLAQAARYPGPRLQ